MAFVSVLIGAVIGFALARFSGLVIGAVLGGLVWQVIVLRRQVRGLQEVVARQNEAGRPASPNPPKTPAHPPAAPDLWTEASPDAAAEPPSVSVSRETPEAAPSAAVNTTPAGRAAPDTAGPEPADALSGWLATGMDWLREFLLRGNPIVRIGIVVLFFGVAFLLKHAADQSLLPIELRLAGVAVGGLGLLGLGWWLRGRSPVFAMVIQGGGVGVLYLTVYAAAQLYGVMPVGLAFAVMLGLVVCSAVLAVLQNAMALAVFGTAGGFLAPVLASSGEGSHVALFSYYALLNVGILGIAWYRAWRILNLLGFVFTFLVGTAWGYRYYQPEYFVSTQPFLVLFFLFFVAIAVLYAFRQPPRLKGYVDASLVFGVPLVGFGLQAGLVRDFEFGLAYSAVAVSAFYLALTSALWRSRVEGMRALTEAFLALGVVFATLAVPLAFDGRLTAAVWALEGAGMIWIGLRQGRLLPRAFGVALQLGAGLAFAATLHGAVGGVPLLNGFYVGCVVMSLGAWASAFWIHRSEDRLHPWEHVAGAALLYWGFAWWFIGGFGELERTLSFTAAINGGWLLTVATVAVALVLARRYHWTVLSYLGAGLLPVMVLSGMLVLGFHSHLLIGWGWLPWLALLAVHYRALSWFEDRWPARVVTLLHALGAWTAVVVLMIEAEWLVRETLAGDTWPRVAAVAPAIAAVFALTAWSRRESWPMGPRRGVYLQGVAAPLALLLALWMLAACQWDGDPVVLAYVPVVNPLELTQIAVLLGGATLYWRLRPTLAAEQRRLVLYGFALLGFVGLTVIMARSVHHFGGVAYTTQELWRSALLQSVLSVFWTVSALGLMALALRRGLRPVWFAGAGLLALVLAKLFLVDLASVGTVARIVSFLAVGGLMLVIGYFTPLPPRLAQEERA